MSISHTFDPRHRRELEVESGIPEDLIAAYGIRTIRTRAEVLERGYMESWQQLVPAIDYPVRLVDGTNGLHVIKADHPRRRKDKPDKFIKYEWPHGQPHRLDVVGNIADLSDPTVDLYVIEGKKKALALLAQMRARGRRCVIIVVWGVWAWCRKKEDYGDKRPELLPDWDVIALDGRRVFVPFDSDRDEKENVDQAARWLADRLDERGAEVYHVRLPSEPDGGKNGVDDLIVRHGFEAFEHCVEAAIDRGPHGTEALRAAWRRQREDIRELREERAAIFKVLHNEHLTAGERIVAVSAVAQTQSRISRGQCGPIRVVVDAPKNPNNPNDQERVGLAADVGLSKNTVRRALDRVFADEAPIRKRTVYAANGDGAPRAHIELETKCTTGTPGMLWQLAALKPPREAPKPAPRVRACPDHPDAALNMRHTASCALCGQLVDEWRTKTHPPGTQNHEHQVDEDVDAEASALPDTQNEYAGKSASPEVPGDPSRVLNATKMSSPAERVGSAWDCRACSAQMLGTGPRCLEHNPPPGEPSVA